MAEVVLKVSLAVERCKPKFQASLQRSVCFYNMPWTGSETDFHRQRVHWRRVSSSAFMVAVLVWSYGTFPGDFSGFLVVVETLQVVLEQTGKLRSMTCIAKRTTVPTQ